ncbi:cell wall biosynthesis regulatory pyridoxal phosphate-dependent protein [Legionella adelaidensis]|uniref:Cell wall biosynthesis regulatory pyridoxal phosphate-dependent protein n=1 Tax=Legionella adelaidensis TaxID=45056 RepID=A0A0W0R4X7_9GAMM|nr:LegC family aminotransferase [Legionella adelaidensis]KTC66089.1 cell wall biosynthesis regulatory pyridoxal phosphate-dependent protein [Legionella adelaidensis]
MFERLVEFIQDQYKTKEKIPLHAPLFAANERKYLLETIDSNFVSSVGEFVNQFESAIAAYTESPSAVVTVNGTSALHIALLVAGIKPNDYVITQPLTFVATCNAIHYCGAEPIFIDVNKSTLGLSPDALKAWLNEYAYIDDSGLCRYKENNRVIRACLPVHTFGHPVQLDEIISICIQWNLQLVEDAAESLGSLYKNKHTGTFGLLGTLSFNGNKIITTGGGGMILTNPTLGEKAKYITTTAKLSHLYEFIHTEIGYNYRMPNLNAALGCAQLEQIEYFIEDKRALAKDYQEFFRNTDFTFMVEPRDCRSNYWLNAIICENYVQRDELLKFTNDKGILARPVWKLMHKLPMFAHSIKGELNVAEWLGERIVNLPSGVRLGGDKTHA